MPIHRQCPGGTWLEAWYLLDHVHLGPLTYAVDLVGELDLDRSGQVSIPPLGPGGTGLLPELYLQARSSAPTMHCPTIQYALICVAYRMIGECIVCAELRAWRYNADRSQYLLDPEEGWTLGSSCPDPVPYQVHGVRERAEVNVVQQVSSL